MNSGVEKRPANRLRHLSFTKFWLLTSALFCLTIVLGEFIGVPPGNFKSLVITLSHYLLVSFLSAGFLLLIAANRLVFALIFPPLCLICGVMEYLSHAIGVKLTAVGIEVAAVTSFSTWITLITVPMIVAGAISLAAGVLLAIVRWRIGELNLKKQLIAAAIGLIISLVPVVVNRLHLPVGERLPYSIYFATQAYLRNQHQISEYRTTYDNTPATAADDSPDIILVLGESLRADHLPFNGYERNTAPRLSRYDNLISFSNVYTPFTYTDRSVAHIMTGYDADHIEEANSEQSFITLFKNAGYFTDWIANQNINRSYAYFAHETDSLTYCNAGRNNYSYDKWLDTDILAPLNDHFNKIARERGQRFMAVVHTAGQHWWYNSHYNPEHALFKPEAIGKNIGALSRDEIINSYDNSIVATDDFIDRLYKSVADRNAVIFFISDHGELLGENGVYLHASEGEATHLPACFVIYTPRYAALHPEVVERLRANKDCRFTTEAVFPTMLDLARISTPALDPSKSMAR